MVDDELLKSAAVSAVRRSGEAAGSLPRSASEIWIALERAQLLGRINIAYSLEPNYFTYRTIKDDKAGAKAATKAAEGAATEGADEAEVTAEDGAEDTTEVRATDTPEDKEEDMVKDTAEAKAQANAELKVPDTAEVDTENKAEDTAVDGDGGAHGSLVNAPRGLFGSKWRKDVPTLCINGSEDQFFGRRGSVAQGVVKNSRPSLIRKGARPPVTGDAGQGSCWDQALDRR